jgi:hypothetical protein
MFHVKHPRSVVNGSLADLGHSNPTVPSSTSGTRVGSQLALERVASWHPGHLGRAIATTRTNSTELFHVKQCGPP